MIDPAQATPLESLLRPLPGDDPSGRSLQYDRVYDQIKEARRADDSTAPRDIWSKDLKAADWEEVQELCQRVLTEESKDLQVCAWLLEAWLHLDGLRGVCRGTELMLQMAEGYWETVHPSLADGPEFRAAPFVWVNEKLPAALDTIRIVSPDDDLVRSATWAQWKRALWLDKIRARRPRDPEIMAEVENSVTIDEFKRLSARTPEGFFREHLAALDDATGTIRTLESFLDDRMGEHSPSLVRFREVLDEIRTWMNVMVRDGSFTPDPEANADMADESSVETAPDPEPAPPSAPAGGPITSRAEAYRQLLAAANYLKQVEPHSPTPYLVRKAVSWGDKSLDDLLREFVREGLNLEALFTFLGIDVDAEES